MIPLDWLSCLALIGLLASAWTAWEYRQAPVLADEGPYDIYDRLPARYLLGPPMLGKDEVLSIVD